MIKNNRLFYAISILSLLSIYSLKAQVLSLENDAVEYRKVFNFLNKGGEDEVGKFQICNKILLDTVSEGMGIYKFKYCGFHEQTYLYLKNRKAEIEIIENYSVENIMKEVIKFFEKNKEYLSDKNKIIYVKEVMKTLEQRELHYLDLEYPSE